MILTREARGHQAVKVLIISETRREVFVRTGSYWRSLDTNDRKFQWSLPDWLNLEYELCNFIVVQTLRGRFNEGGCSFFIVSFRNVWIYFENNVATFFSIRMCFFAFKIVILWFPFLCSIRASKYIGWLHGVFSPFKCAIFISFMACVWSKRSHLIISSYHKWHVRR